MTYTVANFKTKKAFKDAVAMNDVPVVQPGPFGPDVRDGIRRFEGPHYPAAHTWYAHALVKNGVVPKGSKVA